MNKTRKLFIVVLSIVFTVALCIPTVSFANSGTFQSISSSTSAGEARDIIEPSPVQPVDPDPETVQTGNEDASEPSQSGTQEAGDASIITRATDCTATIKYYENVTYEEPGVPPGEGNRYLLGTRTITGLTEGDVLDAWDYVIDLEGFFFFDGWPAKLTISSDPDKNVMELFYFRLWDSSYTVNYYLMEGADLTADNWGDALAPEDVKFTKFATETVENQPFGALVEGDAYEYQIDGAYAIDAYPAEIRVGTDADNNTINVLYVAEAATLPDAVEVPDDATAPDVDKPSGDTGSGSGNGSLGESIIQRPSGSVTVPGDQTFSKDDLIAILPDQMTKEEVAELFEDFIDAQRSSSDVEITDDMAANVVDPHVAKELIAAYNTGLEHGKAVGADRAYTLIDHVVCIIIMIVLLILAIVFLCLYLHERKIRRDLEKQMEQPIETSAT